MGEAPGATRIDLDRSVPGCIQRALEIAVISSRRLIDDPRGRIADPEMQSARMPVMSLPNRVYLPSDRR